MPDENERQFSVSVVIPAYNSGKYLSRAINSVLDQTKSVDEIIVVNDGSTDNTEDVAEKFGDKIKYIYQQNQGASAARNTGIKAAKSEWIAFLDADDEWLPQKNEKQLALLQDNPQLFWVTANYYKMRQDCKCVIGINTDKVKRSLKNGFFENYFEACLIPAWGHTDAMLVKRDCLIEQGLFLSGQKCHNDVDMWFRIAYKYPQIGFINEPLAIYHLDIPTGITMTNRKTENFSFLLKRHLELSKEYNCPDFKPVAAYMLKSWMRGSLFNKNIYQIRTLLKDFRQYVSSKVFYTFYVLTIFPTLTLTLTTSLSRIKRFFKG